MTKPVPEPDAATKPSALSDGKELAAKLRNAKYLQWPKRDEVTPNEVGLFNISAIDEVIAALENSSMGAVKAKVEARKARLIENKENGPRAPEEVQTEDERDAWYNGSIETCDAVLAILSQAPDDEALAAKLDSAEAT